MANYKLQGLRGAQRRRFLRMMTMSAAAVGLDQSGLLNYLADRGGHRLAEAATSNAQRFLGVTCGNGVFAWFQQLWPHVEVASQALVPVMNVTPNNFGAKSSYLFTPDHGYTGGPGIHHTAPNDREFYYSPHAPWTSGGVPTRPMTAIMAGNDETHTAFPTSSSLVSSSSSLAATIGAIQMQESSAIVPVIGIDPLEYGSANGAPDVVTAPSAEGIIDLFNSAASQFTLSTVADQQLFETYYNALVGLRRAAGRSSWQPQLDITKNAARLIGLNFAAALTPTAQHLNDFGITELSTATISPMQRAGLEAFARTLVTVALAFRLGLSNSAIVALSPGPTSEQTFTDPHVTGASSINKNRGRETARLLGKMLDAFYNELATQPDPESSGQTLADTTVFAAWGDTPHTPLKLSNWPDATPMDSNWIYVMGQGYLEQGWFGRVHPGGTVSGFDPKDGTEDINIPSTNTSTEAGAAVAYAVARGDMNKVSEFYVGGPIDALRVG